LPRIRWWDRNNEAPDTRSGASLRVRAEGLEPPRPFRQWHLKPWRLPIPPRPQALRSYRLRQHLCCRWGLLESPVATKRGLMRPLEEYEQVERLIRSGMNDCAISRLTGVPRPTVREWRRKPGVQRRWSAVGGCAHDFPSLPVGSYAYLLGMYLGDGCISRARQVWRLRIALDARYPGIIQRCRDAIDAVMPGQRSGIVRLPYSCVNVYLYSKHWPCLFPQHGPGKKHLRPIKLERWQEAIVREEPKQFVRGLIESDGCRVVANDRGVASMPCFLGTAHPTPKTSAGCSAGRSTCWTFTGHRTAGTPSPSTGRQTPPASTNSSVRNGDYLCQCRSRYRLWHVHYAASWI
jgi:hypothetical protein